MEAEGKGASTPKGHLNIYQKMIEEIEDYAILMLDTKGYVTNWNRGAQKIKGYSEKEILGKHFSTFYLQEDLDRDLPNVLLTKAREQGSATQEGWRKRKDGTRFWGSITITAIHDENQNVIGYSKVTRDLTDKKIAEDNLRMSEERYHQMIAEVQDYAIILLNENGIVQNWNAGAEKIKGYSAQEIIGKSFEQFYTPEDKASGLPKRLLTEARELGRAVQEGWRVRKDGTRFWGTIVITALHGKDGKVLGFSKVTRDLTQQKLASDKLSEYTRELENQNSELEQFAYVASHDLQEPLRKIQTFAELIQQNLDDDEFVTRYFDKLDASARRMSELVKSLLDYSRLSREKKGGVNGLEQFDLNDIVNEVKEDFELLIQEKGAVIKTSNLPVLKARKTQIGQLLNNLVGNSLKFSRTNPVIEISSSLVSSDDIPDYPAKLPKKQFHKITVSDNGIGFEQQYHKLIFSLFQRLHGKQDFAGTGIGLALCKKIVDNHGGFIDARSEPNKGATFEVWLPVVD